MITLKKKILLAGYYGVGKTSLIRQYVYSKFSDEYITTIGVKVDKKEIVLKDKKLIMMIWDVAGNKNLDLLPQNYIKGSNGVFYVFDLTRPQTFENISRDIEYIQNIADEGLVKIIGNKSDLLNKKEIEENIKELSMPYNFITSAKTGENVENAFYAMGNDLLDGN